MPQAACESRSAFPRGPPHQSETGTRSSPVTVPISYEWVRVLELPRLYPVVDGSKKPAFVENGEVAGGPTPGAHPPDFSESPTLRVQGQRHHLAASLSVNAFRRSIHDVERWVLHDKCRVWCNGVNGRWSCTKGACCSVKLPSVHTHAMLSLGDMSEDLVVRIYKTTAWMCENDVWMMSSSHVPIRNVVSVEAIVEEEREPLFLRRRTIFMLQTDMKR